MPRILLVEDSPTQALRLRLLLEDEGYGVEQVDSAEAALPVLNRTLPHLLIVDHHLPGLQGADLCRLIRLHVATLSMPILMLTADETPQRQREGLESGADDFLPKSTDPSLLLLRVAQLLRHARRDADVDVLPQTHFRQPQALMVGFDPGPAEDLRGLLLEEGCHIQTVREGATALPMLAHGAFDVALIAEVLPDMDGLALCRRYHRADDAQTAMILAHRGDLDQHSVRDILATGADDLFTEDALPPLRARLRAILRRRYLEEQNRRLLADFREREGRALQLEAERNAARTRALLADQLAAANRRLADQALITTTITRNVPSGLVLTDADGVATYLNPPAMELLGDDVPSADLFGRLGLLRKPGAAIPAVAEEAASLVAPDGRVVPVLFSITPLDGDPGPSGAVVQIIDVTERRQAEERQALLMAELSHRVKNTLATVLSIGSQTRRRHATTDDFWRSFEGRLRALSETHNLLADHFWEWVRLDEVVRHEVNPYAQEPQDVDLDGPVVELRPKAALALALIFHELSTNAAKYGAFSQPGGHVCVRWALPDEQPGDAGPRIVLDWKETGGPPANRPGPAGFGSTLIQRSIAYELQGSSSLLFEEDGIRCHLEFPMGDVIRRRAGREGG
ncbi:response regulator [Niveispirillum fermenti]|uniref:response regulator n=1 Tax=Niveispirillum fermenti TaxID=1233113 RepID=UPI003A87FF98